MTRTIIIAGTLGLTACVHAPEYNAVDPVNKASVASVTQLPWQDVIVGVPNLDDVPRLFTEIGGFETLRSTDNMLLLSAPGADSGHIRFKKTALDAVKTRPFGSHAWDTGCYFSIMMRAKDIPSIVNDAAPLGWEPLTELAYLEFGPSKLNIIVLGHVETGIQVQLYERLTTPLPEGFTPFNRISRPFNIMQMVADSDKAVGFYRDVLGFETFYHGPPTVSQKPEVVPIGIPKELSMTTSYRAGIVTPKTGLEWGRMEMIAVDKTGGNDLSPQCQGGNIGITEVRFKVDNINAVKKTLTSRMTPMQMEAHHISVKTPDGANITFYENKGVE
ncbi:hypothetical protein [Fretibacter rubidus]|uniref:hypothetical protein n=1 Tax=Fretibacter rubidus TaxID=570162 RepID=UPI00352B4738